MARIERPDGPEVTGLMQKITVEAADDLAAHYPAAWPGRVTVVSDKGTFSREMLHPLGDARNPVSWPQTTEKFLRYAAPRLGEQAAQRVVSLVEGMADENKLGELVQALSPALQPASG